MKNITEITKNKTKQNPKIDEQLLIRENARKTVNIFQVLKGKNCQPRISIR